MSLKERFRANFAAAPDIIAAAPGRVEVIGNHTDYNLGPVIGAGIDRHVFVALRRIPEREFRFSSTVSDIATVQDASTPKSGSDSWVNYPLGVYNSLLRRGLASEGGFELAVESDVPSGAGLSSSAALELATAKAICAAFEMELSSWELAIASREAENEFVGVPCGILDQGVSAMGESGHLVHIDCRNMESSVIPLGRSYSIWIFNTHKKHSLVESLYSERHRECTEAVAQLNREGMDIACLADMTSERFERVRDSLDATLANRAAHVIGEIERVERVRTLLEQGNGDAVGKELFASHASSRNLFENSVEELDYLVDILESMPQVLGARLTGGGFGGAVMALTGESFTEIYADSVASAYRGRFGQSPGVLQCHTADGARIVEGAESSDTIESSLG